MGIFEANDGTVLAFHRMGAGRPLICVPGGPMQASAYLGDLGGLAMKWPLLALDLRGTGDSAEPADPGTYRCDRQVDDLEALRVHLGFDTLDLLAHSGGATIAMLYAARYPRRVGRLALVTPTPRPVGIDVTNEDRRAVAVLRQGEPWFAESFASLERIWAGSATDEDWVAITPFVYGRWDETARSHAERAESLTNRAAAAVYYSDDAFDPAAVRAGLALLTAPVLILAGEYDIQLGPKHAAQYAAFFSSPLAPPAQVAVLPAAGHFPWLDDPASFVDQLIRWLHG
ncbi:alpha/beta fold hydrolase [Dactylosporangium matsuzakiense]|uniref:Hydrolase n=1 Tax=Dactylosporangium matsuzakiense TaxID=53360 RepID=A0A9W6NNV8_9ACTN|nr:alpha/beta hydrolase [Dactylosporangium matsuzakiense]UWZ49207.1 alpha/beta hydrolase [Dactylosporangium matsuzakiense]GLL03432.1 hydrolase [Dactylosporangium matsuzakiense]